MKSYIRGILLVGAASLIAVAANAAKVEKEGKAWLAPHSDPATINVKGTWYDKNWGNVQLNQAEGANQVSGRGDGWDVTGVVSGNRVYLLFSSKGTIKYSAVLTAVNDYTLEGGYANGLMTGDAGGTKMRFAKR
jgi:hypothetical protein